MKRAQDSNLVSVRAVSPRNFVHDSRKTVDDRSVGGGPGMVLMARPILSALEFLGADPIQRLDNTAVVLTDPRGAVFNQKDAALLLSFDQVVMICGHYEGVDERIRTELTTHCFSIGDFVLTGGELPALAIADSVIRLIPGVLGDPESHQDDSFQSGILGHPLYAKPDVFLGKAIPEVLKTGNHKEISKWRRQQALLDTRKFRPDLFVKADLKPEDFDLS